MDLKVENILFDENFDIKLCDFGFTEETSLRLYESNGTQGYMAPEMLGGVSSSGYSGTQADIFALGVLFFTMVFGIPPFLAASQSDDYYKLFYRLEGSNKLKSFVRMHPATKAVKELFQQESLLQAADQTLVSQVSNFLDLAFGMLSLNPNKRPQSVEDLLQSEFLRDASDLSEEEARWQLRRLLANHVQ